MAGIRVRCRLCRTHLLSEESILNAHGEHFQTGSDACCSNGESVETLLFLSLDSSPPWVINAVSQSSFTKGKLECPKCHGRLGSFNLVQAPHKCSCKKTSLPSIHLLQNRIDKMVGQLYVFRSSPTRQTSSNQPVTSQFSNVTLNLLHLSSKEECDVSKILPHGTENQIEQQRFSISQDINKVVSLQSSALDENSIVSFDELAFKISKKDEMIDHSSISDKESQFYHAFEGTADVFDDSSTKRKKTVERNLNRPSSETTFGINNPRLQPHRPSENVVSFDKFQRKYYLEGSLKQNSEARCNNDLSSEVCPVVSVNLGLKNISERPQDGIQAFAANLNSDQHYNSKSVKIKALAQRCRLRHKRRIKNVNQDLKDCGRHGGARALDVVGCEVARNDLMSSSTLGNDSSLIESSSDLLRLQCNIRNPWSESDDGMFRKSVQTLYQEPVVSEVAILDSEVPLELTCPICLDVLLKPHTTYPCSHYFCEICLRLLARRTTPTTTKCPLCRETILNCVPNTDLDKVIGDQYPSHIKAKKRQERRRAHRNYPLPGQSFPWYFCFHLYHRRQILRRIQQFRHKIIWVILCLVTVVAVSLIGMILCQQILAILSNLFDLVTQKLTGEKLWSEFMGMESRVATVSTVFVLYLVSAVLVRSLRLFKEIES